MLKNDFLNYCITISWSLAIASLISVALPTFLGIILALFVIVFGILCCFTEKLFKIPSEYIEHHMTLLFNIFLLVSGFILFFVAGGKLRLFYVLTVLSGFLGILYWIKGDRYAGKSIKQILLDECHFLAPNVELAIIALFLLESIINNTFAASTLIISLILLIDAVSQYIIRN